MCPGQSYLATAPSLARLCTVGSFEQGVSLFSESKQQKLSFLNRLRRKLLRAYRYRFSSSSFGSLSIGYSEPSYSGPVRLSWQGVVFTSSLCILMTLNSYSSLFLQQILGRLAKSWLILAIGVLSRATATILGVVSLAFHFLDYLVPDEGVAIHTSVKEADEFKYLEPTVQSSGECGREVKNRMQSGWSR